MTRCLPPTFRPTRPQIGSMHAARCPWRAKHLAASLQARSGRRGGWARRRRPCAACLSGRSSNVAGRPLANILPTYRGPMAPYRVPRGAEQRAYHLVARLAVFLQGSRGFESLRAHGSFPWSPHTEAPRELLEALDSTKCWTKCQHHSQHHEIDTTSGQRRLAPSGKRRGTVLALPYGEAGSWAESTRS
jgi:hypothetical protein